MTKCKLCSKEMTKAKGCILRFYTINREVYPAIPYKQKQKCHDCGILSGRFHHIGCDMERCPKCKGQFISCDCKKQDFVLKRKSWLKDYENVYHCFK